MNAQLLKICGIALICALTGAVVGRMAGGVAVTVRLAGIALALGVLVGMLDGAVTLLEGIAYGEDVGEYLSLMFKGMGISALCRICSDVCRDCGEPTVASAVESGGRIAMVALAIPAVGDILERLRTLIDAM